MKAASRPQREASRSQSLSPRGERVDAVREPQLTEVVSVYGSHVARAAARRTRMRSGPPSFDVPSHSVVLGTLADASVVMPLHASPSSGSVIDSPTRQAVWAPAQVSLAATSKPPGVTVTVISGFPPRPVIGDLDVDVVLIALGMDRELALLRRVRVVGHFTVETRATSVIVWLALVGAARRCPTPACRRAAGRCRSEQDRQHRENRIAREPRHHDVPRSISCRNPANNPRS